MTDKPRQDKPKSRTPRSKRSMAKIPGDVAPDVNPEAALEVVSDADAAPSKPPPEKSEATPAAPTHAPEPAPAPERAPTPTDRLILPRNGLVTMRRSGGIRFTTRTVTVFRDGRVKATPDPVLGPVPDRLLSDEELAYLYRALEQAGLLDLPPTSGHRNPDAYAYEISAHIDGTRASVEVFDGSIPEQVAPLIAFLSRLLRPPDPVSHQGS